MGGPCLTHTPLQCENTIWCRSQGLEILMLHSDPSAKPFCGGPVGRWWFFLLWMAWVSHQGPCRRPCLRPLLQGHLGEPSKVQTLFRQQLPRAPRDRRHPSLHLSALQRSPRLESCVC